MVLEEPSPLPKKTPQKPNPPPKHPQKQNPRNCDTVGLCREKCKLERQLQTDVSVIYVDNEASIHEGLWYICIWHADMSSSEEGRELCLLTKHF